MTTTQFADHTLVGQTELGILDLAIPATKTVAAWSSIPRQDARHIIVTSFTPLYLDEDRAVYGVSMETHRETIRRPWKAAACCLLLAWTMIAPPVAAMTGVMPVPWAYAPSSLIGVWVAARGLVKALRP